MSLEVIKLERHDCPGCKVLGMILDHEVNYHVTVINIDDRPELNEEYKVMSVPALIFKKDGIEILRLTEGKDFSGEKINEIIEALL